jgi:hypothetical protein
MLKNIFLFFSAPIKLFSKLKENPDLKRSVAIFSWIILLYYIAGAITRHVEIRHTLPMFFTLLFSLIVIASILFISLLYETSYIFLFCRILGARIEFRAILSAVIYCSIPLIFIAMLPFNLTLYSLVGSKALHPFLNNLYQRIGLFEVWMNVMEIIAIKTIAEINYKKATIVVLSSWFISIMLTYFLNIRVLR